MEHVVVVALCLASFAWFVWTVWLFRVKPEVTPPCVECKNHVRDMGLDCCKRVVSVVDAEPRLCSYSRRDFRCKFERKAGER